MVMIAGFVPSVFADNVITVASGTQTSGNVPTNTYYNYSYAEFLVSKEEVGGAHDFSSIAFYSTSSDTITRHLRITMTDVLSNYYTCSADNTHSTDWQYDPGVSQVVFDGNVLLSQGWNEINFQSYFRFNSNVGFAITVQDLTGSYRSPAKTFRTETGNTSGNQCRGIYYRTDNQPSWDMEDGWSNYSGTLCARPNMRLGSVNDGEFIIGDLASSNTSTNFPVSTFYRYSYTQQIFTSAEIDGPQTINSVSFYRTSGTDTTTRQIHVFLGEISRSIYDDTLSWTPLDSMTRVYTGSIKFVNGWNTLHFNTPFRYDGNRNLVLAVYDNTGRYYNNAYFATSADGAGHSLYYRDDNRVPNINSMQGGYVSAMRNVVKFGKAANQMNIGSHHSTVKSTNLPTNAFYRYSYTQQLYSPSELDGPADITSISFYQSTNFTFTRNIDIYLQETPISSFSFTTSWILVGGVTPMFSGQVTIHPGWNTISFPTPFNYSGNNTLAVILDDNTGSYDSNIPEFMTEQTPCGRNAALYYRSDSNNPFPGAPPAGTQSLYRNALVFGTTANSTATGQFTMQQFAYTPVQTNRKYSYTQQLFTAEEMNGPADINTISLYCYGEDVNKAIRDINIYLGEVNDTIFPANQSFFPLSSLQLVYTGYRQFNGRWYTIQLDSVFHYSGHGSLVVAFDDNTGTTATATNFGVLPYSGGCKGLFMYSTSNINPASPSGTRGQLWARNRFVFGTSSNQDITVGDTLFPYNTSATPFDYQYYKYSYSQQIYTAEEMNGAKRINGFTVYQASATPNDRRVKVLVGHTKRHEFASSTQWVPSDSLTLVYNGYLHFEQGRVDINFLNHFNYNGQDNLVVALLDSTGSYVSSTVMSLFKNSSTSTFSSNCYYSDGSPINLTPTFALSGARFHTHPVIRFKTGNHTDVNNHNIYCNVYPEGAGTTTGAGRYPDGSRVPLTATPATGWRFLGWSDNVSFVTDNPYIITVDHGQVYSARFSDCLEPENLTASPSSNSIVLSWTGHGSNYRVQYKEHSSSTWSSEVVVNGSTAYVANGLTDSTQYDFRVRSWCHIDETFTDYATITARTLPAPCSEYPSNVSVISVTPTTATVAWGGSATEFEVAYKTPAQSTWTTVTTSAQQYIITGLTPNTFYQFRVRKACSPRSHGPWSSVITATTAEPPCAEPTNLASTHTSSTITITWNGTASSYEVAWKRHSASSWNTATTVSTNTKTWTGFTDSVQYDYRVRAVCSSTNKSDWVTGTCTTDPVTCNTPTAVATNNVTCSTAVVTWNGSASNYEVSYKTAASSTWSTPASTSSNTYTLTDLTSSTNYNVRVRAVCSANSHSSWATANFTTGEAACPAPTNLAATHTTNSMTITWNGTASNYQVAYKLHSATSWNTASNTSNTSYTFTGLTDSTTYDYRVRGNCSSTNQSTWVTGTTTTNPVTCNTPTAVATNNVTCSTAVVTWNGSASNYEVSYKTAASSTWSTPVSTTSTTYTLTSLDGNTNYNVRVRAVCSAHSHSSWATANFTTLEVPCAEPTNLASTHTSSTITITWNGTASSYEVAYKRHSASSWNTATTVSSTTKTWTGFSDSVQYDYRVRAVCSATNKSDWVTGTCTTDPVTCNTPTAVATNNVTCSSAVVIWSGSASNYEVSYKTADESTWSTPATTTSNTYTLSGLAGNTSYNVRIRAVCSTRSHSSWATANFTTLEVPCAEPTNLASTHTSSTITITWNGTASSYEVAYKRHSASSWNTATTVSSTTKTWTGFTDSIQYDYRVRAVCSATNKSDWVTGTCTTDPVTCNTPTAVATNNVTCSSAVVTWTGSASNYEISYKDADEASWSTPVTTTSSSYSLTGLEGNTSYNVRVRAVCSTNSHSAWATTNFTTLEVPCAEPTNLASTHTSSSITITWNGTASTYEVAWKRHALSTWNAATTVSTNTKTWTGFTDSVQYDYRVRAVCSSTNKSDWVTGTCTTDPVTCNTPTAVATNNVTCSTAVVTWNGSASNYEVSYKTAASSTWSTPASTSSNTYTLTDLDGNTNYNVRVRAVCSANSHSAWATANFTTPETPCAAPTNLASTHTSSTITITWNGTASSYEVAWKRHSASSWNTATTVSTNTKTWTGFTDSIQYDYRVRSVCSSTNKSDWVTGTCTTDPVNCNAPTAVATNNVTCSTAVVTWNGSASSYQVSYKTAAASTWSAPATTTSTTYTLTDLNSETAYNVRVRAVCSANSHSSWATTNFTTPEVPCPTPTDLNESHTTSQLTITWNGTASNYQVAYKLHASSTWGTATNVTTNTYTWSGLTDSLQYDFRVRSYCSSTNYSEWVTGTVVMGEPSCEAPTSLATTSTPSSITFTWNSDADDFEVAIKTQSSSTWGSPIAVTANSYTFTNLNDSSSYSLRVRAICSENRQSGWATTNCMTQALPCGQPSAITATNITDHSATISWTGTASSYEFRYKASDESTWGPVLTTTNTSCALTGLDENTVYNFSVRAVCATNSHSVWSAANFTTLETPCPLPTNLNETHTSSQLNITWDGNAPAYQVAYKRHSNTTWGTTYTVTENTKTFVGFTDSIQYDFRVRSYCSSTNYSEWVIGTVVMGESTCETPTDLVATSTSSSITFSWNSDADDFEVAIKVDTSSDWSTPVAVSTNSYTFTSLNDSSRYALRVRAICSDNRQSNWNNLSILTQPAPCDQPTNLVTTNVTFTSADVQWTGTSPNYEVRFKAINSNEWTSVNTSNSNTTLNNLTEGTIYDIAVRGICSPNSHTEWTTAQFTTPTYIDCNVPTDLTIVTTNTQAYISWMGDASSYELMYRSADNQEEWNAPITLTATSYTMVSLAPSHTYDVRVRSICDEYNTSDWATAQFTTLNAHYDEFPTDLVISNVSAHSAELQWTAASDEEEWFVHLYNEDHDSTYRTSDKPFTCSSLRENSTYYVSVAAIWGDFTSEWSEEISFTTTNEAIDDIDASTHITLYPNPATELTTLTIEGMRGEVTIEVVDNNGRLMQKNSIICQGDCQTTIDVHDLAAGIYFVRLTSDAKQSIRKLIIR